MDYKIRRFKIGKLVRDKIEQFFVRSGAVKVNKIHLNDVTFDEQLRNKVLEESQEVFEATDSPELIDECADVIEVLEALILLHGKTWDEVIAARERKIQTRGGYKERLYIKTIDLPDGSEAALYYANNPEKYPEIPVE